MPPACPFVCIPVHLSVRCGQVSGRYLKNVWMPLWHDHLRNAVDFGHVLMCFLILAQIWLSESRHFFHFQGFFKECLKWIASNPVNWFIQYIPWFLPGYGPSNMCISSLSYMEFSIKPRGMTSFWRCIECTHLLLRRVDWWCRVNRLWCTGSEEESQYNFNTSSQRPVVWAIETLFSPPLSIHPSFHPYPF